ncbi:MAG: TolC family protein [Thermoanaerobaculaceae bacterium]|nr:TolC family protein [Thermoanaerobaculaceae bacterium]MDI9621814.1 TolC family protein [Acidobacteriota bacterium]HPW54471.1 TolC family protein [Thermoanaerobaculaceae bacterium]
MHRTPSRAAVVLPLAMLAGITAAAQPGERPPGLTLAEARARAYAHSPSLAAAAAELEVARAEIRQAELWPNPELAGEVEDLDRSFSRRAESETRMELQQQLPIAVRGTRVAVARLQRDEAGVRLELARRDLAAEVARRFWAALAAGERLRLAEANLENAGEVAATVRALVEGGERSPLEQAQAEAERTLAVSAVHAARRDVLTACSALAEVMGETALDPCTLAGELPLTQEVPSFEALSARLGNTPEERLSVAEQKRLDAEMTLASRGKWPEPVLRLGIIRRGSESTTGYVAGMAIQLPLWDRGQGELAAARARREIGRQQGQARALAMSASLRVAQATLWESAEEVRLLTRESLPRAAEVFAGVNEGYTRGKLGLLEVLEARRMLAAAQERAVEARLRLALARVEVERLVGGDTAEGERQ